MPQPYVVSCLTLMITKKNDKFKIIIYPQESTTCKKSMKNPIFVESGRRGGKIGGVLRAQMLTPQQRSDIARFAALKRWNKKSQETKMPTWKKIITQSEAIRPQQGAAMPFIRCTQGQNPGINHHIWFRVSGH